MIFKIGEQIEVWNRSRGEMMAKKEGMTAGKFLERAKEMVLGWS